MGTLMYMAPEQGQNYGKRIDTWACGIIMYSMLAGHHPFFRNGDNEQSYTKRISSSDLVLEKPLNGLANSLFSHLCSRSLSERY